MPELQIPLTPDLRAALKIHLDSPAIDETLAQATKTMRALVDTNNGALMKRAKKRSNFHEISASLNETMAGKIQYIIEAAYAMQLALLETAIKNTVFTGDFGQKLDAGQQKKKRDRFLEKLFEDRFENQDFKNRFNTETHRHSVKDIEKIAATLAESGFDPETMGVSCCRTSEYRDYETLAAAADGEKIKAWGLHYGADMLIQLQRATRFLAIIDPAQILPKNTPPEAAASYGVLKATALQLVDAFGMTDNAEDWSFLQAITTAEDDIRTEDLYRQYVLQPENKNPLNGEDYEYFKPGASWAGDVLSYRAAALKLSQIERGEIDGDIETAKAEVETLRAAIEPLFDEMAAAETIRNQLYDGNDKVTLSYPIETEEAIRNIERIAPDLQKTCYYNYLVRTLGTYTKNEGTLALLFGNVAEITGEIAAELGLDLSEARTDGTAKVIVINDQTSYAMDDRIGRIESYLMAHGWDSQLPANFPKAIVLNTTDENDYGAKAVFSFYNGNEKYEPATTPRLLTEDIDHRIAVAGRICSYLREVSKHMTGLQADDLTPLREGFGTNGLIGRLDGLLQSLKTGFGERLCPQHTGERLHPQHRSTISFRLNINLTLEAARAFLTELQETEGVEAVVRRPDNSYLVEVTEQTDAMHIFITSVSGRSQVESSAITPASNHEIRAKNAAELGCTYRP